jgi:hypothetical protein
MRLRHFLFSLNFISTIEPYQLAEPDIFADFSLLITSYEIYQAAHAFTAADVQCDAFSLYRF